MKYRDYKKFGPGEYYHIYNRGNGKADVFLDEQDFTFFILRLRQNLFPDEKTLNRLRPLPPNSFSLISYCLMPNHFHLLLRQNSDIPTTKLLTKVCTSYSMYFNKKYNHTGHVFQDQYKQINIDDDSYLVWLSFYIHQNPKVAGFIDNPADYKWSSCGYFIGVESSSLCDKEIIASSYSNREYSDLLESSYEIIKNKKEIRHLLIG